jgi:chemotaxis protein CheD
MGAAPNLLYLGIGELIASPEPVVISTVLGSCVAVSLFCQGRTHGAGGLIHFALPQKFDDSLHSDLLRFGDVAIPRLVMELERMTGEDCRRFKAKVIGGAQGNRELGTQIQAGPANIAMASALLEQMHIPIVGQDVGGTAGRKVLFFTGSGRLQVAPLK